MKPAFNCLNSSVSIVRTRYDRKSFVFLLKKQNNVYGVCARTTANKSTAVDKLLVFVMHNGLTTQITTSTASMVSCRCSRWVWLEHIGYRCSRCKLSSQAVAVVGSSYAADLGTSPVNTETNDLRPSCACKLLQDKARSANRNKIGGLVKATTERWTLLKCTKCYYLNYIPRLSTLSITLAM